MKNENVKTFKHDELGSLRAVMLDGRPWFLAKDVTKCLGYRSSSATIHNLVPEAERTVIALDTGRGMARTSLITSHGLFCLADRSIMPGTKKFACWVRTEVLPALRGAGVRSDATHEKPAAENPPAATRHKATPPACGAAAKAEPAGKTPDDGSPEDDGDGIFGGLLIIIVEEG